MSISIKLNYSTMLFILTIFTLIGCSTTTKETNQIKTLSYLIQPDKNGKTLNVEFEMTGSDTGTTWLKHSKTWAGNDFTKDITDFKIMTLGATLTPTTKGDKNHITKIVTHKPSERIKISYKITQNVPSPDKTYRAIITKKYFHIIGQAGLVTPDIQDNDEIFKISMEFKDFPKNYKFANSFFVNKKKRTFKTTVVKFLYGVYVGGDYRVKKMIIKGKPLYVSIRGKWKFRDKDFFKLSKNIVSFQRNFFNDHNFDQFLINVLPNERTCCSSGGTGLTNSFATFMPDDATLESHVKALLSHELFHTWNGRRIERQEPEQLVYWFSEGFTDYYSRLLLLRSGDLTLKELVDDYNEVLYNYYTSEAINYSNQRILKDFWNDYQVEKLPYRRGNILARKWNAQIKTHSQNKNSMDNILLDYFKEAQTKGTVVSSDSFIRLASKYYPGGFQKDISTYIEKGNTLTPGENDLGPCVKRLKSTAGKFEHGYDSKKTYKSLIFKGVNPKSAAYKAGIRNGQKILSRKIHFPPTKPSWVKIADKNGKEKTITFLPVKIGKKKPAYFFKLDEAQFKDTPDKCLAWFKVGSN